jgi:hypothetical protein
MISIRSFLRRNVLYMLGAFLLIVVTVQVKSHQECSGCPTKSSGLTTCDFCPVVHDHPDPDAEITVSAWSCAGFTQANANVGVGVDNLQFYNGGETAYTGWASGQVGNADPVIDVAIGVSFYRDGGGGGGGGVTILGSGVNVNGSDGGGQWTTDTQALSINDWRFPTSRNSASSDGYVNDWDDIEIRDSSNAQYNGSLGHTTAADGRGWTAAVCDPTSS